MLCGSCSFPLCCSLCVAIVLPALDCKTPKYVLFHLRYLSTKLQCHIRAKLKLLLCSSHQFQMLYYLNSRTMPDIVSLLISVVDERLGRESLRLAGVLCLIAPRLVSPGQPAYRTHPSGTPRWSNSGPRPKVGPHRKECPACGKSFSRLYNCRKHMERMHNSELALFGLFVECRSGMLDYVVHSLGF